MCGHDAGAAGDTGKQTEKKGKPKESHRNLQTGNGLTGLARAGVQYLPLNPKAIIFIFTEFPKFSEQKHRFSSKKL
jgi:threonine/homoserine/homoserine lactone efflux protein